VSDGPRGAEFTIGAEVVCSDGACGCVARVIVDPVARVLTHLVVEPRHGRGLGRLVPIDAADAGPGGVRLRCSLAEFGTFEEAEETRFLADTGEALGYGAGEVLAWPHYGLGPGMGEMASGGMPGLYTSDRVPAGEVEICRGDQVHATDGDVGRVRGLVVDAADHSVTHVLLHEGHLWGRRQIAVPIGAVKDVAAVGVRLRLSRDEVRRLPPVDLLPGD